MRAPISALLFALLGSTPPAAGEMVATFTLDGLSYVSFQDEEVLPLGSGSTIRFHFGTPLVTGGIPFTLSPSDVEIPPIPLPGGETLSYTLASGTSGTMQPSEDGRVIAFTATVNATLDGGESPGTRRYTVPFTTETVSASSASGDGSVEVTGLRPAEGVWYGQIVGATPNQTTAYPAPGTAVYIVLSGQFDQLP